MPRNRSGRSSRPAMRAPPPAPVSRPPPPAPMQQQQQGGGMVAGLASTIAQGVAFGTGSAVAHRAVDSVMGPRTVQHEHVQVTQTTTTGTASTSQDVCQNQAKAFQDCLNANSNDVGKCQFYVDMLNECRKSPTPQNQSNTGW